MRLLIFVLFWFVISIGYEPHIADAASGRTLAKEYCESCHGKIGISRNSLIPNLNCQKKKYLVRQLERFRISGHGVENFQGLSARSDVVMEQIAKDLSHGDIIKIANFYAKEVCQK